jgi:glycosyltransferase involved in cell wall biosynthesis
MTVAVPNWNGAAYLGRALDSLCANRPHVHWWLQDAASTDNSLAIAGNYRGPHDVIVSKSDRGQADALNRAFAEMGGDVIGFLNSDDEMAPARTMSLRLRILCPK